MACWSKRAWLAALALALGCGEPAEPSTPGNVGGAGAGSAGSPAGGAAGVAGVSGSTPSAGGAAAGGGMSSGGAAGSAAGSAGASSGSAGMSGGGTGGAPATPSAGCTQPANQDLAKWVEQPKLDVNGKERQWWLWLPAEYDPTRAYPVVFTLHGCGGPTNFIPMQEKTGKDAIVVRGTGADPNNGVCWTYGGEGDDVKFFDAMLSELQAKRCVDTSRVFSMGYSSGAWMTNTLECTRGDKLRATGTLSGGRAGNGNNCKGKFARATVHDLADPTNPFDEQGADKELARVLAQNHCDAAAEPVPEDPAPCARYQGCDAGYPVIACRTQGKGHQRQDALAMDVFWRLFSSL